ncbi:ankyrin repeat-containing domain protein [Mycena floridula]|nr:ankyrin repeat-containing domain protein [Mycena floridula]
MTAPAHPTALRDAAQAGHLETVKFILEQGADVNLEGGIERCALASAARKCNIEVMEYLLNQGANPNAHDHILYWAVIGGLEAVQLLIDKGAYLQAQGQSALETASRQGNLDIAKLLIETGVNPRNEGGNALQEACLRGHLEIVKLLVKNGGDFNALGGDYRTTLLAAIRGGKSEVVKFLIESGADFNASAGDFETPPQTSLQLAIQKGHKEIEKILRRHGARE